MKILTVIAWLLHQVVSAFDTAAWVVAGPGLFAAGVLVAGAELVERVEFFLKAVDKRK